MADLVRLRHAVRKARRGADFRQRFWDDIDLHNCVVVHLADSGHVNGTPENDEIKRYRSIGGFFLVIANPEVLDGKPARAVIMESKSGLTKRVCRSTLTYSVIRVVLVATVNVLVVTGVVAEATNGCCNDSSSTVSCTGRTCTNSSLKKACQL